MLGLTHLMLELRWVPTVYWYRRAVHMKLSHNTAPAFVAVSPHQFRAERSLVRALSQTQQADEDVTFRVLIREERFPPAIGCVVPAQEFHRLGTDFVMDLMDLQRASPCGRMWEQSGALAS